MLPCSLLQEPPSVAFQLLAILNKIQQRECHAPTRIAIHIKHSPHVCWLPRKHWQKEEKQNFLFFIWKPSYLIRSVVGGFCFGVSNNEKISKTFILRFIFLAYISSAKKQGKKRKERKQNTQPNKANIVSDTNDWRFLFLMIPDHINPNVQHSIFSLHFLSNQTKEEGSSSQQNQYVVSDTINWTFLFLRNEIFKTLDVSFSYILSPTKKRTKKRKNSLMYQPQLNEGFGFLRFLTVKLKFSNFHFFFLSYIFLETKQNQERRGVEILTRKLSR